MTSIGTGCNNVATARFPARKNRRQREIRPHDSANPRRAQNARAKQMLYRVNAGSPLIARLRRAAEQHLLEEALRSAEADRRRGGLSCCRARGDAVGLVSPSPGSRTAASCR
jgi:hypothetical protein